LHAAHEAYGLTSDRAQTVVSPAHTEPSPSRRGTVAVLIFLGVSILVAAAIAGYWYLESRPPDWSHLDRALDSFPVPDGYTVTDRTRSGEHCAFSPTCEKPTVSMTLAATATAGPACTALDSAAAQWVATGFVVATPEGKSLGTTCNVQGTVTGLPAEAFSAGPSGSSIVVTIGEKS